jgi:hypothetical protein
LAGAWPGAAIESARSYAIGRGPSMSSAIASSWSPATCSTPTRSWRRCAASVGAPPPGGTAAERGLIFAAVMDGRRIREELGFRPAFPRLADAVAAGSA